MDCARDCEIGCAMSCCVGFVVYCALDFAMFCAMNGVMAYAMSCALGLPWVAQFVAPFVAGQKSENDEDMGPTEDEAVRRGDETYMGGREELEQHEYDMLRLASHATYMDRCTYCGGMLTCAALEHKRAKRARGSSTCLRCDVRIMKE